MPAPPSGIGHAAGRRAGCPGGRTARLWAGFTHQNVLVAVLASIFVVLTTGCQVETEVAVEAEEAGNGRVRVTVELDEAATKEVPDLVGELRVEDLRRAGWEVKGPYRPAGGGAEVVATKGFGSPEELAGVIEEVGGARGPFQEFALDVDESALHIRTAFRGTVDLTRGLESFSDPGLAEKLGGEPLGVSREELEERAGVPLDRAFVFRVVARLPGRVRANTPSVAGNTATWTPGLGERVDLVADAELARPRLGRIVLAVAMIVVAALAVVVLVFGTRMLRRMRSTGQQG